MYVYPKNRQMKSADITKIHRMFFARLFPHATKDQIKKATDLKYTTNSSIFKRGQEFLKPSKAYIDKKNNFMISDMERPGDINSPKEFTSAMVLESRSHRAKFLIDKDGKVSEFKGLTPYKYDLDKINRNSDQPEGLFCINSAIAEVRGLNIIGELETGLTDLKDYFNDLNGFAQIFRGAKPGSRYYSWMRMDASLPVYELLADLEGVSIRKFLPDSGARLGQQLRKLHDAGMTLHHPYDRSESIDSSLFLSHLHSGNVEIHGNIIDLESMHSFSNAEDEFDQNRLKEKYRDRVPKEIIAAKEDGRFSFVSRISDLNKTIMGLPEKFPPEPSLYQRLAVEGKEPGKFFLVLSAIIGGYYKKEMSNNNKQLVVDGFIIGEIIKRTADPPIVLPCMEFSWNIFRRIEENIFSLY